MTRARIRSCTAYVVVLLLATACTGGEPDRGPRAPTPPPEGNRHAADVLQLDQPRAVHRSTRLEDGRVLLTGGCTQPGCGGFDAARTSDVFDPASKTFQPGPSRMSARASGTATLLDDGRVLLTGGYPGEGMPPQETAEVFDPQTNTFSPGPRLDRPRAAHVSVALGDAVLLVGGTVADRALASTSLWSGSGFVAGPNLATPRVKLGAVRTGPARVLVVGGARSTEGHQRLKSTEVIDVGTGVVRAGPALSEGQYKLDSALTEVPGGDVVIAGGQVVNVYDPDRDSIRVLREPILGARSFVCATAVGRGRVLVTGGYDASITPSDQAWLVQIPTG